MAPAGNTQGLSTAVEKPVQPDQLDEKTFSLFLDTANLPDPDLLIRTSGEMRLSNFLLWQCAYTEFWITPVLWPDFRKKTSCKPLLITRKGKEDSGASARKKIN